MFTGCKLNVWRSHDRNIDPRTRVVPNYNRYVSYMTSPEDVIDRPDDPVLNLVTTPIPSILWHYTDFEGFRGIVGSKSIRATNLKFLNDKEEFEHAFLRSKRLLLDLIPIEEAARTMAGSLVIETFERIFTEGPLSPPNLSLFTASFTVHGDQLSQWRGYSRGSAGVSLGFDLTNSRKFTAPATPVVFAPCIYSDQVKDSLLRKLIASYLKITLERAMELADMPTVLRSIEELEKARPDQSHEQIRDDYLDRALRRANEQVPEAVNELAVSLLRVMALLKHSAFEEEQEWRYVFPVFANMPNPPELKFRAKLGTLVPYFEFPLIGRDSTNSFQLREVILGPGSEDNLAINSTRAFLDSAGLKEVKLSRSRIPYRPQ